ncbi:hypothetical protein V6R21_23400 [Limibacter armeniacum]|uniref:hypothetical protein n=1 Tax=Limibacter armeniacum TaxID=466084 RepID=UPI002FE62DC9
MKFIKLTLSIIMVTMIACNSKKTNEKAANSLNKSEINLLTAEINEMLEKDQRYRKITFLGTLNDSITALNDSLSKTATSEDYIIFLSSVTKDLTQQQDDSLSRLQHQMDYENYLALKDIIKKYGYPSKERLGKDLDLFPILTHPPIEITPKEYLEEMTTLLKTEVVEKRMSGQLYATFYDNIKHKILKEPQFYGTGQEFNHTTMQLGNPTIANIEETNKARAEIGLPALKEGEYSLVE